MSMVPWGRLVGLSELERAMNRLAREGTVELGFPVDVEENPEAIVLRADLPGIKPADITVEMTAEELTVKAERPRPETGAEPLIRERRFGTFLRTFQIGVPVQTEAITAGYENGILTITVPKSESGRTRVIPVTE